MSIFKGWTTEALLRWVVNHRLDVRTKEYANWPSVDTAVLDKKCLAQWPSSKYIYEELRERKLDPDLVDVDAELIKAVSKPKLAKWKPIHAEPKEFIQTNKEWWKNWYSQHVGHHRQHVKAELDKTKPEQAKPKAMQVEPGLTKRKIIL